MWKERNRDTINLHSGRRKKKKNEKKKNHETNFVFWGLMQIDYW